MSTRELLHKMQLPSGFEFAPLEPPAILVVDDREENLFAMKKLLAKVDAKIFTANSGADALALSLRHKFSLILLDVQMPTMNGFEVAEYLRENEATAHVPIIFLTAISKDERFVFQGYESGAVDYLFKPIDSAILLAKVRVFLDLARMQNQLKQTVLALTDLNERQRRILEAVQEGVVGFNLEGVIQFANPMAHTLLVTDEPLVGKPILPFLSGPHTALAEWPHHPLYAACLRHETVDEPDTQLFRSDGTAFPAEYHFGPFAAEAGPSGGVLVFSNIAARKAYENALRHQATFDALTGIPNRALFMETLARACARAKRAQSSLALLFLDLDGFKPINDQYGHQVGDELLKGFAQRCQEIIRAGDLFARYGGDEFVVLLEDAPEIADVERLGERLVDAAAKAFEVDGHLLTVGVSIGLVYVPDGDVTPETLLTAADEAMYEAKRSGKSRWKMTVLNEHTDPEQGGTDPDHSQSSQTR